MKRSMYMIISSVLVLVLTAFSAVWAAETREEKGLTKEATEINTMAKNEKGEKVVARRLEKEFTVTDTQIQSLRSVKLGYGEIAIVFSLAQKMPGGISDANIQNIMTLRQGPPTMGWGAVANKLGTKLGPTVSQVGKVNRDADREMKHAAKGGGSEMHQNGHEGQHGDMTDHGGGMGNGQGMSHGKGR